MKIQFDGEIDDIPALLTDLKGKNHKVVTITTSRWIGYDENGLPFDRGGRIDVELADDTVLRPQEIVDLDDEIKVNPKVKKPKKNQ